MSKGVPAFLAQSPRPGYDMRHIEYNKTSLFQKEEQAISTSGTTNTTTLPPDLYRLAKQNTTTLPPDLYRLAKQVFDELPDEYLPGYKSSCWMTKKNAPGIGRLRCLPYFYILGVAKCGTSDLWDKINAHPHVVRKLVKEPHWWTRYRLQGISFDAYLQKRSASLVSSFKEDSSNKLTHIVGDGSASTLWDNRHWMETFAVVKEGPKYVTADILRAAQPNAKFIVILRDPVPRLYSDYLYFHDNPDQKIFHNAAVRSIASFGRCIEARSPRACAYTIMSIQQGVRLNVGLYSIYIRDWLKVFPRDQIFILKLEDWHSGCEEILPRLYAFLNLKILTKVQIRDICQTQMKNTNTEKIGGMFNETRIVLQEFYSEWNRDLSNLLGDTRFLWP
ncbi:carbohydrate sulfotransferase 15-like [Lytechinus variegatus]|uniref:carbohydrate sulfotransferase 15-like n=1 Tax=Lytechinus variegatus TaxID=7654 RepID=UPI001BB11148|nr:carbohydrate sulfotransferase 15-like [Lytechinus variegatus]